MSTPLGSSISGSRKDRKRTRKWVLILLSLTPIPLFGAVLAANVTITGADGTANVVEFGQGSATATACDTSITTSLNTSYNGTTFMLSTIVLSNVDGTASGCYNKSITVTPASNSTGLATAILTPTASVTNGTYTLTPSPSVTASLITKVLIQTQ